MRDENYYVERYSLLRTADSMTTAIIKLVNEIREEAFKEAAENATASYDVSQGGYIEPYVNEQSILCLIQNEQLKNKTQDRLLGDYDIWYEPCKKCGYDTGKSSIQKDGNKTCWKCGEFVRRDFSDRALKVKQ